MTYLNNHKVSHCRKAGEYYGNTLWNIFSKTKYIGIAVLSAADTQAYDKVATQKEALDFIVAKVKVEITHSEANYWPVEFVCQYKDTPNPNSNVIFKISRQLRAYSVDHNELSHTQWYKELSQTSNKDIWDFSTSKIVKPMTKRRTSDIKKITAQLNPIKSLLGAKGTLLAKVHGGNGRVIFKATGSFTLR